MEELNSLVKDFRTEFNIGLKKYWVHIQHYEELSQDAIIDYRVLEGEFLVHLFSSGELQMFKVLIDDKGLRLTDDSKPNIPIDILELIELNLELEYLYANDDDSDFYE